MVGDGGLVEGLEITYDRRNIRIMIEDGESIYGYYFIHWGPAAPPARLPFSPHRD